MSFFRLLFKAFDWLRLDADDFRFSLAAVLGALAGLIPVTTLHGALVVALFFCLRINPLCGLAGMALSALLSAPFDFAFHALGVRLLTRPDLHRLWSGLYHWPVFPYTRFNNSVVMGRTLVALASALPLYFACRFILRRYRASISTWLINSPMWSQVASTRVYRLYVSYHETAV